MLVRKDYEVKVGGRGARERERSLLTKFLPSVNHSGRGIIGREVFQILLPRPGCHSRKLFRSTIKIYCTTRSVYEVYIYIKIPVGGVFRVDHFRQDEIGERFPLGEGGGLRDRRSENWYFFAPRYRHSVLSVVRARVHGPDHDENVLKLRAYPPRAERQRARLLKTKRIEFWGKQR